MSLERLTVSVPSVDLIEALGSLSGNASLVRWDLQGAPPASAIDIVVAPFGGDPKVVRILENVETRLIQSQSVGYDDVASHVPANRVFANAASVHETATAELAITLILASQRGIPTYMRNAMSGIWERSWQPGLADKNVLLVGYGGVNRAVDLRLQPFEVNIQRVSRTPKVSERGLVDELAELPRLLPEADIIVVAVPLTTKTFKLIGENFLSSMRDGALLVNIARGPVADTEALLRHSRGGRLRLALDVTDPEPLPADHPLLALPNVLITPHVGGATEAMLPRMARLIITQVDRLQRGEDPIN